MLSSENFQREMMKKVIEERIDDIGAIARKQQIDNSFRNVKQQSVPQEEPEEENNRFVQTIREGSMDKIKNAILEVRREIKQHKDLGRISTSGLQIAKKFHESSEQFLKKKLWLEDAKQKIEQLWLLKESGKQDPSIENKYNTLVKQTKAVQEDTLSNADTLIKAYEQLDNQVQRDRKAEKGLQDTFKRCLDHLSQKDRGKLEILVRKQVEGQGIDRRINVLSKMIEQLSASVPSIRKEEVTRLYQEAKSAFEKKYYQESAQILDKLFKFDRKNLGGHRLRAEIYKARGNRIAFLCELRMIAEIPDAEARDFTTLADVLLEDGQTDDPFMLYEKAIAKQPSRENLERLADLSCQMRRWYRAVQLYQQILKTYPDDAGVMHKLGAALYEDNRKEEGFDILRNAIQLQDNNAQSHVCVGRMYRRLKDTRMASQSFARAIELEENNADAYYWRSVVRYDRAEFEEALQEAQKAETLEKERPRNVLHLARCKAACNQPSEAIEILEPLLKDANPAVDVLLAYSEFCRQCGRVEKALKPLGDFVKRFSWQPQIRAEYALLLTEAGRLEEASQYLNPNPTKKR